LGQWLHALFHHEMVTTGEVAEVKDRETSEQARRDRVQELEVLEALKAGSESRTSTVSGSKASYAWLFMEDRRVVSSPSRGPGERNPRDVELHKRIGPQLQYDDDV